MCSAACRMTAILCTMVVADAGLRHLNSAAAKDQRDLDALKWWMETSKLGGEKCPHLFQFDNSTTLLDCDRDEKVKSVCYWAYWPMVMHRILCICTRVLTQGQL